MERPGGGAPNGLQSRWRRLTALGRFDSFAAPLATRCRSGVVGKARELALDVAVPPEAADRALPSAAHRLVGLAVCLVAGRDLRLEVAVLGLDDFVVVLAMVLDVAGAAELLAGHGLHGRHATAAQPWALL